MGWGGSVSKMLATQAWEPEFTGSAPVKIQVQKQVSVTPALGRHRPVGSWSSLANQPNCVCEFRFSERPCLKKVQWRGAEEGIRGWSVVSTCTDTCACVCSHEHIHTRHTRYPHPHMRVHVKPGTAFKHQFSSSSPDYYFRGWGAVSPR